MKKEDDERDVITKISWGFSQETLIRDAIRRNPHINSMRKKIARKKIKRNDKTPKKMR